VTGEDEAEAALVLALRGALKPEAPLAGVATATLASLSELERQVLGGAALPFDTQPVYRAAVLRLRVASALATVPSPPARVDGAAVQRLLGELDAVLGEVKPLAAGAPPEHQLALEAVRNALVREAVNFSEAAHRLGEGSEPAPSVTARPHAPASAATPRVLSVQAGSDVVDERETRRRRTIWAIFAVVILAGAAVHGYRYFQREKAISALPSIPGAPDGMMLLPSRPGMPRTLMPVKGAPDRQQLEKFRAQQLLLGYKVIEQAGGVLVIVPVPPPAEGEPAR
jgi:hypothetical protein